MPNNSRLSYTNAGLRKYPTFADVTKNGASNTGNQNEKNDNATKVKNSGTNVSRGLNIESSLPTSATTSDSYEWRVQERRGKRKNVAEKYLTPKRTELTSYPAVPKTVTNTSVNIVDKNNNNYKTDVRTHSGLDRPIERARNGILKNLITQTPEVGVIFNQRTSDYYLKAYGISENTVWSEVVKGNHQRPLDSGLSNSNGTGSSSTGTATGTLNLTVTGTATGSATRTAIGNMTKYNREELNEQRSQYKIFTKISKTRNYSSNSYNNNNNYKNKISFNKTIEHCESKYSFEKKNAGKKNQIDSNSHPLSTTYTFGNFEKNEVSSNNSRLVLRSPRSPPSSETEEKFNEDQAKAKNQTMGINKSGGSGKPTLEYRLEQQILTLKGQNLTVNQLYIVDLMEDLLLKYQAEVYGTDESKPQSNGFSNNYNNNNHRNSDVAQLAELFERPTGSGQLTNQKISSTTVVLETVEEKRERNKGAAKPAQFSDNNAVRGFFRMKENKPEIKDESQDGSGELVVGADAGNYTNGWDEASHAQRWNHIDECGNIVVGIVNPEYHSEWDSMEVTEIYRKSAKREDFLEERKNNKN